MGNLELIINIGTFILERKREETHLQRFIINETDSGLNSIQYTG